MSAVITLVYWTAWLAWFFAEGGSLIFAKPNPRTDEIARESQAIARRALPADAGDDAAQAKACEHFDALVRLIADLKQEVGERWQHDDAPMWIDFSELYLANRDDDPLHPKAKEAAAWALQQFEARGGVAELDALTRSARFVVAVEPAERRVPVLTTIRLLRTLCLARMADAVEAGDRDRYCAAAEHALMLGRLGADQGTSIARLVAMSLFGDILNRIRADVMHGRLPPDSHADLIRLLNRYAHLPPDELWVDELRVFFRQMVAESHSDNGSGNGRLLLNAPTPPMMDPWFDTDITEVEFGDVYIDVDWPDEPPLYNIFGVRFASRAETIRQGEWLVDRFAQVVGRAPAERAAMIAQLETDAAALTPKHFFTRRFAEYNLSTWHYGLKEQDDFLAAAAGTRALLAVEAYRLRNRTAPPTLDALVPDYLSAVPIDPWSGAPLRYEVFVANKRGPGMGYILYSVWTDGHDDGGTRAEGRFIQKYTTSSRRDGRDWIVNDDFDGQHWAR